jgi:hypothetical protein
MTRKDAQHGPEANRWACAAAAAVAAALMTAPALAAPLPGPREAVELEESPEGDNVLTLKLAALEVVAPIEAEPAIGPEMAAMTAHGSEVVTHVGVAFAFERTLIDGWLAAEINVLLSPGDGGLTVPTELFLKKPFALSPVAEPFVGVGLAAEWIKAGEHEPEYGLASVLGSYFWVDPSLGLVVETEYSLLVSRETEHEIVLAAGGAVRF